MKFRYRARDQKGEQFMGVVAASSQEAALQILDRQNLYVTHLGQIGKEPLFKKEIPLFRRISIKEVMFFSRQLSIMFRAQVPLIEAITTIASQTKNAAFREKIFNISEEVEAGTILSQALAKHPDVFSSFYVQMVRRGEALGRLSDVLENLADHLERAYYLKSKVRGAMVYPLFILILAGAVLSLLVIVVLPNLTKILRESGQDLPVVTEVVISLANFYQRWWWLLILVLMGVGILFFRLGKTAQGRRFLHAFMLRIPLFGSLLKMMYISRFGENLSTLISGGVSIVQALDITADIVGNEAYKSIIGQARDEVKQGNQIVGALQKYPSYFPPVFTQMIRAGEQSGKLDTTLLEIVRFYQKEVDRNIDMFLTLLEPLLIAVLGIVVGVLMAAIIIPLYQIISTFGG
ncbi:MAG: type II secretion system F family protein [Patescibacteria group bacterium]